MLVSYSTYSILFFVVVSRGFKVVGCVGDWSLVVIVDCLLRSSVVLGYSLWAAVVVSRL